MKTFSKIINFLGRYGWSTTLIVLAVSAVGFTWSSSDDLYDNIRLFDRAALTISSNYVENINEYEMIKAGIDGILGKLDQYSRFLTGADYAYLRQETDGKFDGIGVTLEYHHDTLTVESVMEGSPGYAKGVKPGDRILYIDSSSTMGLGIKKVKLLLKGSSGTRVRLQIFRPQTGDFEIVVQREQVELKAIPYFGMINSKTGYIRLSKFFEGSSEETRQAIRDLNSQGMASLILDLRDNPGGLLVESIEIVGLFLSRGKKVVETRARDNFIVSSYISDKSPVFEKGGLVVLVNSQTASAAEIVAGAIQDHDRGIVVGSPTYGKGLVQQVIEFSDDSALKLTTAKYYLPSGRCLQKSDWSKFELSDGSNDDSADSLYQTESGRPVFGGGGINPDIYIEEETVSDYVQALESQAFFFDFALAYISHHPIDDHFRADEAVCLAFKDFTKSRKFSFQDKQRQAFNKFKDTITLPGPGIKQGLEIIDRELTMREEWEFESHYSEVARKLRETILLEALGENALYRQVVFNTHAEVSEALRVLQDDSRYSSILAVR